ncbi:hypothetical protein AAKU64_004017 [Undibacterium sp. GrIS 1.8]|uniref:hypothetical protein n=1 Tax=Undibacterium sp. GrIS 1.8 TaxID=3143934 RepID=UPI003390EF1A
MKPIIQQMPFSEFSKIADAVQLFHHGRRWKVCVGDISIGFSDAMTAEEAKRNIHKAEVNNSLYFNDGEASNSVEVPLPSALVLEEYPDLFELFPNASQLVALNLQKHSSEDGGQVSE